MTSTPVRGMSLGTGGPVRTGSGARVSEGGGFQALWNSQTDRAAQTDQAADRAAQADGAQETASRRDESGEAGKTRGESLKARDEHRARTQRREPIRNAEERTDIPEEDPEAAGAALEAAAALLIQETAQVFGTDPEAVCEAMAQLGMEQTDILTPQGLSDLILALSGAGSPQALLTDETLYGSYQALTGQLETLLQESADALGVSMEQLVRAVRQETAGEAVSPETPEAPVQIPAGEGAEESRIKAVSAEVTPTETASTETAPAETTPIKTAPTENTSAETMPPEAVSTEERPTEKSRPEEGPAQQGRVQQAAEQPAREAGTGADNGRRESRRESADRQDFNPFLPNIKAQTTDIRLQSQTYSQTSVWDADTQNIMRQIMDYMKINLKADMSAMEMQLHPASLGTLQVQVASKGGVVTANFITQNEAVKAALESQLVQLQEQFEAQGVKVEAIEVTVRTHQFEQNLEQGRRGGGQDQEQGRRSRARRINLNDPLFSEKMEEEDVLARSIMEANGNTVDYTA